MSSLTFDELIRTLPLSVEDAVALTLGAADALEQHRAAETTPSLPNDAEVTLSGDGTVALRAVDRRALPDEVRQLASLLRRLLKLEDERQGGRPQVPGALVVLIARSVGHIDAPPPAAPAFRAALLRFVGGDAQEVRAAVYHRAAGAAGSRPAAPAEATPAGVTAPPPFTTANGAASTRQAPVAYRRRGARQWIPGAAQGALAISGAVAATLVLVTLAGQGPLQPAPVGGNRPTESAAAVAGTSGATVPEPAPRVAPAASTRVIPSRTSGTPKKILDAAVVGRDAFSPSYARSGNAIYFHAGRAAASLMRASIDGDGRVTDVSTVLADGASNFHVTVSPDGSLIAFDSDRDGVRAVYVARADGSRARRVSGAGYAAVPSWSPDGRRLAFIKSEPGRQNVWNVWVSDLPGAVLHRVTNHATGQAWGASWFPDGKRIAYSRERQLVIADLSTGTATAIGSPVPGRLVRTPAVSPDGTHVIFQVHGDGAWMLDVTRQRVRKVLTDRSAEEFVWSPDGRHIAYHAMRNGAWAVWTMATGA